MILLQMLSDPLLIISCYCYWILIAYQNTYSWCICFMIPRCCFFIVAEATVVVKQEKLDEVRLVPETEQKLVSCFCPHGFSSATRGHYHCRYCGLSSRFTQNITRHEKVHKNFLADKVNARQPRYYSCRHCGFLSRYAKNLWRHEKRKHGRSQQARALHSKQSRVPTTSIAQETKSASKVCNIIISHFVVLPHACTKLHYSKEYCLSAYVIMSMWCIINYWFDTSKST